MFKKYLSVIFNTYHNETCKSNNMCSIFTAYGGTFCPTQPEKNIVWGSFAIFSQTPPNLKVLYSLKVWCVLISDPAESGVFLCDFWYVYAALVPVVEVPSPCVAPDQWDDGKGNGNP